MTIKLVFLTLNNSANNQTIGFLILNSSVNDDLISFFKP